MLNEEWVKLIDVGYALERLLRSINSQSTGIGSVLYNVEIRELNFFVSKAKDYIESAVAEIKSVIEDRKSR